MHKHSLLPLLALLALAGCHVNPACEKQIGLMRSELLALEDKYYLLEAKYQEAVGHASTDSGVCDPLTLPAIDSGTPIRAMPTHPSNSNIEIQLDPRDASQATPPSAEPIASQVESNDPQADVQFRPPRQFASNDNVAHQPAVVGDGAQVGFTELPHSSNRENEPSANQPIATPRTVSDAGSTFQLVDPAQILGRADDDVPGDDGFSLVVQIPQEYWSAAGVLTVSVLDPEESAERQRVGLWRITAEELVPSSAVDPTGSGTKVPLDLKWNLNLPSHAKLKLFVRWENPGNEPLEVSDVLDISLDRLPAAVDQVGFEEPRPGDRPTHSPADGRTSALPSWQPHR